ncbi:S-adenosyl-L-methionine-dependent methyltransferase [Penicillium cosmopolitanum]|uniref:S-adenosyl-L-methionine-dependent methyltransferase n=1 Tax=Penicillium cosmopolitanum TaxID=1131564 RepID=A0A9W9W8I0_9EURO|nr:S-adenosyl-L-methionine-dependent methyltransferase [Penicillium cosmopolitanum]KAJ5408326.1 S-adenosyl-L-methionine-dependent methyltransferase [Penicillium cosmopolitanum]
MTPISDTSPPVTSTTPTPTTTTSPKIPISLTGVSKTLLIPLIARAYDNSLPTPILADPYPAAVLSKLSFDIDSMPTTPFQNAGISLRTKHFDDWTSSFLRTNHDTTVLHLACGFDSRAQRVSWSEGTRWIDIDLPEVIELRKEDLPLSFPTGNDQEYSLLGIDVTGETWMRDLDIGDGPVLVIMEGLLSYLPEKEVRALLTRICETFPQGEIIFECVSSPVLNWLNRPESMNAVKNTGAVFKSAVDDPMTLENLHSGLKLVENVSLLLAPGTEKFPLLGRVRMYLSSWFQSGRDSARFLRFRFGQELLK